ncbi:MAG: fluoride efflux transporter CrcB [Muribaculaceae bacterium]|nr:fluoride efflux transporter CrcB [Muribaculaceae bacterium]MBR6639997.1 fluoride efflux transporter CrcB [Muribaculaceae bacterium]
MVPIINFLMVAIGGAIGSCLRYGIGLINGVEDTKGLGTFIVNVAGCFVIGALFSLASRWDISEYYRVFLFVGLLGGFTTFSTYALDILTMSQQGEYLNAILYFLLTNVLGIIVAFIGMSFVNIIAKSIA